jgi:hypothetical protein
MRRWLAALFFGLTGCLALSNNDDRSFSCSSNDDCTNGHVCMVARSRCAPPGSCDDDWDCATDGSRTCNNGQCGGARCTADATCHGFRCEASTCLVSCASRGDCADGNDCVAGKCEPATCSTDADCGGYPCDGVHCATTCVRDADCAKGFLCDGNGGCHKVACLAGNALTQCHAFACGADGSCLSRCASNADCAGGLACQQGRCACDPAACGAYACNGDTSCFTSCYNDSDCAAGRRCSSTGTCQRCVGTAQTCLQNCYVPGCLTNAFGDCSGNATACADLTLDACTQNSGCHIE